MSAPCASVKSTPLIATLTCASNGCSKSGVRHLMLATSMSDASTICSPNLQLRPRVLSPWSTSSSSDEQSSTRMGKRETGNGKGKQDGQTGAVWEIDGAWTGKRMRKRETDGERVGDHVEQMQKRMAKKQGQWSVGD